ncbi:MAG TPA: Calx-beta domain-containing protein, partial [Acidimicrobiia bacterium]|nr:Calx-beta domain-containing protein [Acidimicrobiia bacterium]
MLRRSTSIAAIAAVLLASCVLFVVDAPEAQAQEPAPHLVSRLTIGDATIVEGSGGTKAGRKLALRLSQPLSFDLTVNYTTDGGTATAPSDYKDKDGKVTIKAGKTIKFLSPKVIGDDVAEGTETFSITLTSATPLIPAIGSVFFAKRQGTVT